MNLSRVISLSGILLAANLCSAAIENLRCEYLTAPLGIEATNPQLSWTITSSQRNEKQTAYQVLVASSSKLLAGDQGDLWDSGKVVSDETSQIVYAGTPLVSRQSCFWKVQAWDRDGKPGAWSPVAQWHMGLLQANDWSAKWICHERRPIPWRSGGGDVAHPCGSHAPQRRGDIFMLGKG